MTGEETRPVLPISRLVAPDRFRLFQRPPDTTPKVRSDSRNSGTLATVAKTGNGRGCRLRDLPCFCAGWAGTRPGGRVAGLPCVAATAAGHAGDLVFLCRRRVAGGGVPASVVLLTARPTGSAAGVTRPHQRRSGVDTWSGEQRMARWAGTHTPDWAAPPDAWGSPGIPGGPDRDYLHRRNRPVSMPDDERLLAQTVHYVSQGYEPDVALDLARSDLRLWDHWPGLFTRPEDPRERQ